MLLIKIGRAFEQFCPSLAAKRIPIDLRGMSSTDHPVYLGGTLQGYGSDITRMLWVTTWPQVTAASPMRALPIPGRCGRWPRLPGTHGR